MLARGPMMALEDGQASIELVAGTIATLVAGLIALQLLAVGYGVVMAGHAAEAAALAIANGRDARTAAREAIPGWPARALDVDRNGGDVRVRLSAPVPFGTLDRDLVVISRSASVRAPGG